MSDLARVSLSLEESLLASLEKLVGENGYENRSEYIRDLIREQLTREEWKSGGEVIGTLTLIYNHHQRGVTEKLVELQHHSGEHVLASTHVHLSHEICAEMIMLRGQGAGIVRLTNAMKKLRGVLHAELAMSTTGEHIS
jgi:CopG family nickel-responsive transcriptional regulator